MSLGEDQNKLIAAVLFQRNIQEVQRLLDTGVSANVQYPILSDPKKTTTLLHSAVKKLKNELSGQELQKMIEIIALLVKHGANPNAKESRTSGIDYPGGDVFSLVGHMVRNQGPEWHQQLLNALENKPVRFSQQGPEQFQPSYYQAPPQHQYQAQPQTVQQMVDLYMTNQAYYQYYMNNLNRADIVPNELLQALTQRLSAYEHAPGTMGQTTYFQLKGELDRRYQLQKPQSYPAQPQPVQQTYQQGAQVQIDPDRARRHQELQQNEIESEVLLLRKRLREVNRDIVAFKKIIEEAQKAATDAKGTRHQPAMLTLLNENKNSLSALEKEKAEVSAKLYMKDQSNRSYYVNNLSNPEVVSDEMLSVLIMALRSRGDKDNFNYQMLKTEVQNRLQKLEESRERRELAKQGAGVFRHRDAVTFMHPKPQTSHFPMTQTPPPGFDMYKASKYIRENASGNSNAQILLTKLEEIGRATNINQDEKHVAAYRAIKIVADSGEGWAKSALQNSKEEPPKPTHGSPGKKGFRG